MNLGFSGKGNASQPERAGRADRGRRLRPEAARGLGHDARPPSTAACRSPTSTTCRWRSTPTRSTSRASSRTPSPPSRAAPSTPSTPKAPAAATRPTSSRSRACRTCCPSSTNPTRPVHGQHARRASRHADGVPPPRSPTSPRTSPSPRAASARETIAAEDILHDLGAFSMISSDSQAMGRVGEVIIRTWQTAHKMKVQRGRAAGGQRPATTTSASSATSPSTRSTRRSPTASAHEVGSHRGRQARRPRAVEPGLLRREAGAGAQGRHHRRGADGRPQRLDPDAAAGALPADVRRLRPRHRRRSR